MRGKADSVHPLEIATVQATWCNPAIEADHDRILADAFSSDPHDNTCPIAHLWTSLSSQLA